jgi:single-strand DNA-binding protein
MAKIHSEGEYKMPSYCKVIAVGNITRPIEVRYAPSGTAVASFTLAINHKYKTGGEVKEDVCFVDVTCFGSQAESCGKYLDKGSCVLVDGRLSQRKWEDKETGAKRSKIEIIAQFVNFIDSKKNQGADGHQERQDAPEVDEGSIPF